MPRREFLYDIRFWEARRILRGYRNRYRDMWSATRWQAFYIMSSMADLKKAGIYSPTDLIKFPWEKEDFKGPTEDEMEDLKAALHEEKERLNRKQP